MRRLVLILAVAMIAVGAGVAVVVYDRSNASQPQLVNPPVHVFSEGVVRICAQDKRDDVYETKITATVGHLSKPSRLEQFANSARNENGRMVTLVNYKEVCSTYFAPTVKVETTMYLSAWQNGKKTDEAEVTLMPDMGF